MSDSHLSEEHQTTYEQEGYVVVRGLLDPEGIAELLERADGMLAGKYPSEGFVCGTASNEDPDDPGRLIKQIMPIEMPVRDELLADDMVADENIRVGLDTLSLYAVEVQIACYIKTTSYDEFVNQKHRIMVHLLEVIEGAGVKRAIIRRD